MRADERDKDDEEGSGFSDELQHALEQERAADANDEREPDQRQGTSHSSHCDRRYAARGSGSRRARRSRLVLVDRVEPEPVGERGDRIVLVLDPVEPLAQPVHESVGATQALAPFPSAEARILDGIRPLSDSSGSASISSPTSCAQSA